jgi:hypothetical protein
MLIAKSASETRGKKRSMKRSKILFRPPTLFQSSSQNRPVDLGQGKELKDAHAGIPSGNPYLEPSSQTDAASLVQEVERDDLYFRWPDLVLWVAGSCGSLSSCATEERCRVR